MAKKSFNAQMQERFVTISTSYAKANSYVHETAMLILDHAKACGDCSTAQGLVMALPASARREMLILWFSSFTPIVVKNSEDWNAKMHKEGSKLFKPFNREEAEATPWFVLAEQNKEHAPLDGEGILKAIAALAKRLDKKADEGEIQPEWIDGARAAVVALGKIKIAKASVANDETVSVAA